MIRSSNGVRLLSSHLIRDACKSIYEGVFNRKLDSGICTISRVIGVRGHGTVNPNNSFLSNTSIRGSVSLSKPDYERSNCPGLIGGPPIEGVSEKDFRKGFKKWYNRHGYIFCSEGEKEYMFKWFRDHHPYSREFYHGYVSLSPDDLRDRRRKFGYTEYQLEKLRSNELDQVEVSVFYSNKIPRDENLKKCCSDHYKRRPTITIKKI